MAIREELTLGLQGWKRGMDEARNDVRRLNTDIKKEVSSGMRGGLAGRVGGGIASMGTDMLGAMGLAGGATGLAFAIKGALTQADDLADLTVALNESAEGLQRVDFAAQQAASIGIEQVAKSMLRLERSLGDVENAAATDALENLGLSASRLAEMSLEEKILALSEAFQKARETGTGMADIQDLMGRTAADLVPLFEQGGDALRAMFEEAPVMAEETVQQMARVNDQIDAMIMKSKTWLANAVGGTVGLGGLIKDTLELDQDESGIVFGLFSDPLEQLAEIANGLARFALDPKGAFDAAVEKSIAAEDADIQAAADREEKRKAQGAAMAESADRVAAEKRDEARLAEADKAEEEIVKERARRAAERARDAEAFEKASFSRMDPQAQMEKLRARIAESLGVSTLGDAASIEAGADALASSGRAGLAASVLTDLSELESIAGRMPAAVAVGSGSAQGSFATLMDQIFGRGTAEMQLDEIRQTRTAAQDQKILLDKILTKMDEPPERDVWAESV